GIAVAQHNHTSHKLRHRPTPPLICRQAKNDRDPKQVGDRNRPDRLRIVLRTADWTQASQLGSQRLLCRSLLIE
ncbi:MAG TPA: hypothetical protein PLY80_22625, partial [Pseudomonadota bacterium]|nr:hypothetical protein [Pseudomonadota bacterium]